MANTAGAALMNKNSCILASIGSAYILCNGIGKNTWILRGDQTPDLSHMNFIREMRIRTCIRKEDLCDPQSAQWDSNTKAWVEQLGYEWVYRSNMLEELEPYTFYENLHIGKLRLRPLRWPFASNTGKRIVVETKGIPTDAGDQIASYLDHGANRGDIPAELWAESRHQAELYANELIEQGWSPRYDDHVVSSVIGEVEIDKISKSAITYSSQ